MAKETLSLDSLAEATRGRASFSGHGTSMGAQGFKVITDNPDCEFLSHSGQTAIINPQDSGFGKIVIGAAWDSLQLEKKPGFLDKLFKKTPTVKQNVDIDLGCLYEMNDGTRGCIQAFGDNMHGAFDHAPYILFSGDERTGDKQGHDEHLDVNGARWPEVKRMLVYVYIYRGVPNWSVLKPQIQVLVPGEHPMVVTPDAHMDELAVCAVAMIENVRNGIRLTNHTEYFPGHAEMDRAFGFGLEWADGNKY